MTEAPTQAPAPDKATALAASQHSNAATYGTIGAGLRARKPGASAPGDVR